MPARPAISKETEGEKSRALVPQTEKSRALALQAAQELALTAKDEAWARNFMKSDTPLSSAPLFLGMCGFGAMIIGGIATVVTGGASLALALAGGGLMSFALGAITYGREAKKAESILAIADSRRALIKSALLESPERAARRARADGRAERYKKKRLP